MLRAFPSFELSYESSQPHKTVDKTNVDATNVDTTNKDIFLQMPQGRRFYVWFTVDGETGEHAVYHVNQDRTICTKEHISLDAYPLHLFFGTVVTAFQVRPQVFVMTDLHVYRGVAVGTAVNQRCKWTWMTLDVARHSSDRYMLPVWSHSLQGGLCVGYKVHHVQRRSWEGRAAYVRIQPTVVIETTMTAASPVVPTAASPVVPAVPTAASPVVPEVKNPVIKTSLPVIKTSLPVIKTSLPVIKTSLPPPKNQPCRNVKKPQYSQVTTFWLKADEQYDLYRLYGYGGPQDQEAFVDFACVLDMRTSKWLNGLFRQIRENRSLDAIEESDDEADFEDVRPHKYTDLDRRVKVRCRFQPRLRKWVPVEEDRPNAQVIALHRL